MLLATDTFLAGYIRAAEPGQLASLREVIAGAERVKAPTRELWAANGTDILEGYGVTECSPVLACNQRGAQSHGTVGPPPAGHRGRLDPVPGLAEGRRLFVRGPNIMAGYLLRRSAGRRHPAEGRLARHRRYRHHGSRTATSPSAGAPSASPSSAARWSRSRRSKTWSLRLWNDAQHVVLEPARSAQGRAADPRHRQGRMRARTRFLPTPAERASPSCGCRSRCSSCRQSRCWPPARSTCRRRTSWRPAAAAGLTRPG